MKKLNKDSLKSDLNVMTTQLLNLVRMYCFNTISDNTSFIISEIVNNEQSLFEKCKAHKKINDKKTPKSLEGITEDLKAIYENLYDVNLHVYKSLKNSTIVEIRYYPKSAFDSDYYETVKDNQSMLHAKIAMPPYRNDDEKFDVNWELGGFKLWLKMTWSLIKFKWKYRHRLKRMKR